MWRTVMSALSPAGQRGRLSILIFHRVLPAQDALFPNEVHAAGFDRMCGWLAQWFQVLPLGEAIDALKHDRLPARALVITFDDGYADNHEVARPILQRHGLPATFYIATGFLDGGRMFNDTVIEAVRRCPRAVLDVRSLGVQGLGELALGDVQQRRQAIGVLLSALKYLPSQQRSIAVLQLAELAGAPMPDDLMMRSDDVRALRRAGMTIGAHTVSHPILSGLAPEVATQEISQSRQQLESLLGERVAHFAYPNGVPGRDFTPETARLVQQLGFDSAVTTGWGAARSGSDAYQLPRFTPWDRRRAGFAMRMAHNLAVR